MAPISPRQIDKAEPGAGGAPVARRRRGGISRRRARARLAGCPAPDRSRQMTSLRPSTRSETKVGEARRHIFVGIVEKVEDDLLEQGRVAAHERQVGRDRDLDRAGGKARARMGDGVAHRVADVDEIALDVRARRPRAASCRGGSRRSARAAPSPPRSWREGRGANRPASCRRAGARLVTAPMIADKRRAQIMRERGEERAAQPFALDRGLGLRRLVDELGALDRDRGLVDEGR